MCFISIRNNYKISIPKEFILFDSLYDSINDKLNIYVNIEMYNDWNRHAETCKECGEFFKYIFSKMDDDEWVIEYGNEVYHIIPNNFGDNYLDNICSYTISYDFTGSRLKLKTRRIRENDMKKYEISEKYEMCNYINKKLLI